MNQSEKTKVLQEVFENKLIGVLKEIKKKEVMQWNQVKKSFHFRKLREAQAALDKAAKAKEVFLEKVGLSGDYNKSCNTSEIDYQWVGQHKVINGINTRTKIGEKMWSQFQAEYFDLKISVATAEDEEFRKLVHAFLKRKF
jgi:hypothetical protein